MNPIRAQPGCAICYFTLVGKSREQILISILNWIKTSGSERRRPPVEGVWSGIFALRDSFFEGKVAKQENLEMAQAADW